MFLMAASLNLGSLLVSTLELVTIFVVGFCSWLKEDPTLQKKMVVRS